MKIQRINKNKYQASAGEKIVGISQTVPRLSLSVSELVKRFTLTTLKEMETKSLLNYDFQIPEDTPLSEYEKYFDRLDLSAASAIDLTDYQRLAELARKQIADFKELSEKQRAENERLQLEHEAAKKQELIDEAKKQLQAEQNASKK